MFDASLVEGIPDLPQDSAHWWGPESTFFSSPLGKNLYTVVGGVYADPEDENAMLKDVNWDEEARVELLRERYAVSSLYP